MPKLGLAEPAPGCGLRVNLAPNGISPVRLTGSQFSLDFDYR